MKLKVLVLAAALSFGTGIGCTYKPARVAAPQPLPPPATQPAVAPEDQPPSPNSMTDLVITAEPTPTPTPTVAPKALVVLLPNQYPNMPPRIGKVLQYCAHVCTENWSGSYFGGARNPSNICIGSGLQDGQTIILAHVTQTNPDGINMSAQLAPDGKSRCIFYAPQCTVSNGCLSVEEKKKCPSCGG